MCAREFSTSSYFSKWICRDFIFQIIFSSSYLTKKETADASSVSGGCWTESLNCEKNTMILNTSMNLSVYCVCAKFWLQPIILCISKRGEKRSQENSFFQKGKKWTPSILKKCVFSSLFFILFHNKYKVMSQEVALMWDSVQNFGLSVFLQ